MYATIAQAKSYVEAYYSSTNPLRLLWEALSDGDKNVLLNRAEQTIDSLPLLGTPLAAPKGFPREPNSTTCMENAKSATIELAIQSLDEEASSRHALQRQGVHSYRIGDLSETFTDGKMSVGIDQRILSIVFSHLQTWLSGGYKVCPTHIRK